MWILKSGRQIDAVPSELWLSGSRVVAGAVEGIDMCPEQFAGDYCRDGHPGEPLTSTERREISEKVKECWDRWAESPEENQT